MKIKLVADSSANTHIFDTPVTYPPLKIVTAEKEYVDNTELDTFTMLKELRRYKGKSSTSCPSVSDWTDAFDSADIVLGVAITSNLSGSYNAAQAAAEEYMAANPGAKVFILDSLSTGPEMQLILEKYVELISENKSFDEIVSAVREYHSRTHLLFSLESLHNLSRNGRVSPTVAAAAGILGIRVVGKASAVGTLETMNKCRGEKKALNQIYSHMKAMGFNGGKVRISHSYNEEAAAALTGMILSDFPSCDVASGLNRGLCCFYAEEGGLLVGFEG